MNSVFSLKSAVACCCAKEKNKRRKKEKKKRKKLSPIYNNEKTVDAVDDGLYIHLLLIILAPNYANKLFFLNFIYYIIYNITTQNSKNNLLASASGLACFFCSVLAIKRTKKKK